MKKFKILILFTLVSSVLFYSCTSKSDDVTTEKSLSLRAYLQQIKSSLPNSGKSINKTDDSELCFDFVYPITLSYNTGAVVSVNSYNEIISLLESETSSLYLEGIAFPFQVISSSDATITTINNESDFVNQIEACGYDDTDIDDTCYDLIYPFSLINSQNEIIVIDDQAELIAVVNASENETLFPVFPFSVMLNGQVVVLNNEYEFYELSDSCDDNSTNCVCPTNSSPVCVIDENGNSIQFDNACFAECEGYDSSEFVNCN